MLNLDYELKKIDNLIENKLADMACNEFLKLVDEFSKDENKSDLARVYKSFGEFLFKCACYDESLDMLINAYKLDYMKDEILNFCYDKFVNLNVEIFKNTYNNNLNLIGYNNLEFEDLKLDFMMTNDNEYFVFDKELKEFKSKIVVENYRPMEYLQNKYAPDEYSDIVIYEDWNYESIRKYLNIYKINRKIYIISDNLNKLLSFLMLSDNLGSEAKGIKIFSSVEEFQTFFEQNNDIYLPFNIITDIKEKKDQINKALFDIHNQRIKQQNRNDENILLTIGILSYNRGTRALEDIKELIKLKYDAEIEFLVSNDGSTKNTDGYKEIQQIEDCRISYYELEQTKGLSGNFYNIIDKAKGKFVFITNDVDITINGNVPHYLRKIVDNENASVIATRTEQTSYRKDKKYTKGEDAICNFSLSNNYISGTMYNKELIKKYKLDEWLYQKEQQKDNEAYIIYPHEFLDIALSKYGNIIIDSTMLVLKGPLNPDESLSYDESFNQEIQLPKYALYTSRIEELEGWCRLIKEIIDDDSILRKEFINICNKIFFLVSLVKNKYTNANYSWEKICNEIYQKCIEQMEIVYEDLSLTKKVTDRKQIDAIKEFFEKK